MKLIVERFVIKIVFLFLGADVIITYFTPQILEWTQNKSKL